MGYYLTVHGYKNGKKVISEVFGKLWGYQGKNDEMLSISFYYLKDHQTVYGNYGLHLIPLIINVLRENPIKSAWNGVESMNTATQKAILAQKYAMSSKPYHIIERQQLTRGYARVIYKCRRCERRIARLSLHDNKIIGFKSAESFPLCPYCEVST